MLLEISTLSQTLWSEHRMRNPNCIFFFQNEYVPLDVLCTTYWPKHRIKDLVWKRICASCVFCSSLHCSCQKHRKVWMKTGTFKRRCVVIVVDGSNHVFPKFGVHLMSLLVTETKSSNFMRITENLNHQDETTTYQKLPFATCPQLFHRGGPLVGQSSCHRNSILLGRPK